MVAQTCRCGGVCVDGRGWGVEIRVSAQGTRGEGARGRARGRGVSRGLATAAWNKASQVGRDSIRIPYLVVCAVVDDLLQDGAANGRQRDRVLVVDTEILEDERPEMHVSYRFHWFEVR